MAAAVKGYLQGVYKQFQYLGNWLPNSDRQLGDIGVLEDGVWRRLTSLRDFGITFAVRTGTTPTEFIHTSHSGVKIRSEVDSKLGVLGADLAEAKIAIEFSQEGAFVFHAPNCLIDEIEDQHDLGNAVVQLYEQGRWEEEWSVIDTVVKAESATIVVSNSKASKLELGAKGPLQIANLSDAGAGISVISQSGNITRFVAVKGLTPLFNLRRLKKSFLGSLFGSKPVTFGGPSRVGYINQPHVDDSLERVPLEL